MTTVERPVGTREAQALIEGVESLRRFVDVTAEYLPKSTLDSARTIVDRAGQRLALSREHTVVALAGATGSGKSSVFNQLAGVDRSPVGVRRPTTGVAHASVWGGSTSERGTSEAERATNIGPDGAADLLDWLGVPGARRFEPVDDPTLTGLVLLDLPDFDSVEADHRVEVDRLLGLVDVMVWVLDPQKYADRVVHRRYLSRMGRHRDVTVVVLNQIDRLLPGDADRCLADLRRLLEADGLSGVPVMAGSAVGPPGLAALRDVLRAAVAARRAALRRLAADVDGVVAELTPVVAAEPVGDDVDRDDERALTDALAVAAGVPVVARATAAAYVHRARRSTGWPPLRWLRRFRPDPLGRLRLGGRPVDPSGPVAATSVPPAAPAAGAAVGLALRTLGQRAGGRLPEPWPAAVLAAARSRADDLADALDLAVATTDLGMARRPAWWRFVGAVQWLLAVVALLGLAWLVVRYALFALALPEPPVPEAGRLPVPTLMLAGGLLGGLLLSVLTRPVVGIAARRKAVRATRRLREAVAEVARELVLAPVRRVLRAHAEARTTLNGAAANRVGGRRG
jgi:hypothetical protein